MVRALEIFSQKNGLFQLSIKIKRPILIDTKPLLLFLVGIYDVRTNSNHLNSFGYTKKDFHILRKFFEQMKINSFVITPHIFTEFCYWIEQENDYDLKLFIKNVLPFEATKIGEKYIEKDNILKNKEFEKFGATDTSIIIGSEEYNSIITDEYNLSRCCDRNYGKLVINFKEDIKPIMEALLNK